MQGLGFRGFFGLRDSGAYSYRVSSFELSILRARLGLPLYKGAAKLDTRMHLALLVNLVSQAKNLGFGSLVPWGLSRGFSATQKVSKSELIAIPEGS